MDSFAAYVQPTLEYAAKLGLIIPMWMLLIITDKYLLGLPLSEGSLWRSPRIPPRFAIKNGHGGEFRHSTGSSGDTVLEEAISFGPSPVERGFTDFATPYPQPSHAPHLLSNSLPVWASGTTALSLYQPLEVHDPFDSSSRWLEPGYVGSAVLLVLVFAFLGIMTNSRWYPFGKSQATQARKISDVGTKFPDPPVRRKLTERMEFPICWESTLDEIGLAYSGRLLEDSLEQLRMLRRDISVQTPSSVPAPLPPPQTLNLSTFTSVQTPPSMPAPPSPPQTLSLSTITSVQTPPSVLAPPTPPPTLSISAIISVDRAPSTPVLTSPVLGPSTITSAHQTPSAPSSTPPATPYRTPAESVEGGREESGGVREIIDTVKGGIAASKKRRDADNGCEKPEKKDKNENEEIKSDAIVTEEKQEDHNSGSKKHGSEAGEEDGKEGQEKEWKRGVDEDLMSDSGGLLEHDGIDGAPALGEGKTKKKKIRQNAKKRLAKRAAAEQAGKEVGEAPNACHEDKKECEEKAEKAKEVGEASEAFHEEKKAREDKEGKGKQVGKDPGASREDTKEHEDEEANGKNDANNAVEVEISDPPETGPDGAPEAKKKKRRRRGRKHERSFLANIMPDSWQGEEAQAQQLPNVAGQSEDSFVLGGEDHEPVGRPPMKIALGRAQINDRVSPDVPIREGHDHAIVLNPPNHQESQGGRDYQRLKNLLHASALRRAQTNNGAISDAPLGDHRFLTNAPHHGQFQGRAPSKTPIRNDFPSRLPWVASAFPYTRRSYAYPDQGTTNHVQRAIFFGPGVESRSLVGPSASTPWTSNNPISWRSAGSFAWQGPWNEPATRAWDNSAGAGIVSRGRPPHSYPPLEHRIDGFVQDANLTPFRAPFFIDSQFLRRSATATSDGLVPFQGPSLHVDDTNVGEIDGLGIMPAITLADRSAERYQYFPERGIRSRSSPPRSRSQSRSPVRNRRSRSSLPRRLSQSEAEDLPQVTLEDEVESHLKTLATEQKPELPPTQPAEHSHRSSPAKQPDQQY